MPFLEGFGTKLAASLAAGVIKAAGVRFGKKLGKTEAHKALEQCGEAAVKALVAAGLPEGSATPREHLEEVLGTFAADEVVHDILARAIREGSLPPEEVTELRQAFEAEHPREVLPDFDVEKGVAAFVVAFVDQADEEEAFQGLIQTKELRAQTRYLRDLIGLVEDVRDRLPDPRGEREKARRKYLEALRKKCLILPVVRRLASKGLDLPRSLEQVYIQLDTKTLRARPGKGRAQDVGAQGGGAEEPLSALDAFLGTERFVLLGAAGSGKTTFAKAVLAKLAASGLNETVESPPGLSRDLVPVLVVLEKLSTRLQGLPLDGLAGRKRERTLEEAVRNEALADLDGEHRVPEFAEGLCDALDDGRCLLIFDGFDEVREDLRPTVLEAVLAAVWQYEPRKVLVTSRVSAYGGDVSLRGFTVHELAPLDEWKVLEFCNAWYEAQGELGWVAKPKVATGGEQLGQQVLQRPFEGLADNPLLLTTMAIIHSREGELPERRAQVYETAIDLLILGWQQEKRERRSVVQSRDLQKFLSDGARLWPVLERIAFEVHRIGRRTTTGALGLPRKDLWELLSAPGYLGSVGLAEEFLNYANQSAGLLVGLRANEGQPAFGFLHQIFENHLAGRYLTRSVWDPVAELYERAGEQDLWGLAVELGAEALLYVDRSPKALLRIAFELGRSHEEDSPRWRRGVLWAGKMTALLGSAVVEQEGTGPVKGKAFLEELRARLTGLLTSDLSGGERSDAARILAQLEGPAEKDDDLPGQHGAVPGATGEEGDGD